MNINAWPVLGLTRSQEDIILENEGFGNEYVCMQGGNPEGAHSN